MMVRKAPALTTLLATTRDLTHMPVPRTTNKVLTREAVTVEANLTYIPVPLTTDNMRTRRAGTGVALTPHRCPNLPHQSRNDTRLPGSFLPPDSTYRQSDANSAAILAEPDGRLCSTDNCKRFSRFSSTDFEWPACCTPCYSHGSSSHSRTCDAS